MKTYQQGETAKLTCSVADADGTATNPGTMKIVIDDPTGAAALASTDMTNDATGSYSYHYNIAADAALGVWTYECVAVNNARTTITGGKFQVVRRTT